LAAPEHATGLSVLLNLAWQPWRLPLAPYVEAGAYGGFGWDPIARGPRWAGSPRASAGVLLFGGVRLGSGGALPFEAPASPQRHAGVRLGYTRWFYTGDRGGSGGVELSLEVGFGR
jgi:hypothetical protein